MRGAQHAGMLPDFDHGIIPAYAGSTCPRSASSGEGRDHPRVCGEHSLRCDFRNPRLGSSPRMRGAHNERDDVELGVGIIPAYAGSTRRQLVFTYPHRDHPRVCGEHSFASNARRSTSGSSPRMRGAQFSEIPLLPVRGIIPAYAGSTRPRAPAAWSLGDHPRVCGEHILLALIILSLMGSSPRMRGALLNVPHVGAERGIIPAYAGSTGSLGFHLGDYWDHPRVCGEHNVSVPCPW